MRQYYVYLLASDSGTLYIGVTNDLKRRLWEHKLGRHPGFTQHYRINKLVYFETTGDVRSAIAREKQLKSWSRAGKIRLIEKHNPDWRDLSLNW